MKNDPATRKILDMVESALTLAESVKDDIEEYRRVSDDTIICLNDFTTRYHEAKEILDLAEKTYPKENKFGNH